MKLEKITGEEFKKLNEITHTEELYEVPPNNEIGKVQLTPEYALVINIIDEGGTYSHSVFIVDVRGSEYRIVAGSGTVERPHTLLEKYHMLRFMQELGVNFDELANTLSLENQLQVFDRNLNTQLEFLRDIQLGYNGKWYLEKSKESILDELTPFVQHRASILDPGNLAFGLKLHLNDAYRKFFGG